MYTPIFFILIASVFSSIIVTVLWDSWETFYETISTKTIEEAHIDAIEKFRQIPFSIDWFKTALLAGITCNHCFRVWASLIIFPIIYLLLFPFDKIVLVIIGWFVTIWVTKFSFFGG